MKAVLIYPPEIYSASQVASAVQPPLGKSNTAANLIKHAHHSKVIVLA